MDEIRDLERQLTKKKAEIEHVEMVLADAIESGQVDVTRSAAIGRLIQAVHEYCEFADAKATQLATYASFIGHPQVQGETTENFALNFKRLLIEMDQSEADLRITEKPDQV